MYCPQCQTDSPLVALQPDGLVCARCQSEIVVQEASTRRMSRPDDIALPRIVKQMREGLVGEESDPSANSEHQVAEYARRPKRSRMSQIGKPLKLATVLDSDTDSVMHEAGPNPLSGEYDFDDVSQLTRDDTTKDIFAEPERNRLEPLYRFDPAHPSLGSRPRKGSVELAEEIFETAAKAIRTKPRLHPIPRTFLFLRSTNPWPARWTFLASALFIAGQSFLLWSFLRGLPWGVATGVLTSAWAFAMSLYVIAQYCDDDAR